MSHQEIVNSNSYWDQRFETDWDASGGQQQSRFFSHVAIDAMPQWLLHAIRWNRLTVCDWGCAEGAGTETLAQVLSWDVTGIDFSGPAIERARQRYGRLKFSHENLLDAPARPAFDVLFSSNTLEHFPNPWEVFNKIANYAAKFVVLLLPYREFDRHSEHEVTFDAVNIPVSPNADWALIYRSVIDTRALTPTYWPGDQILLIYARTAELSAQRFMLADMHLSNADGADEPLAFVDAQGEISAEPVPAEPDGQSSTEKPSDAPRVLDELYNRKLWTAQSEARRLKAKLSAAKKQAIASQAKVAALLAETEEARRKIQQLAEENASLLTASHQSGERIHFLEYREQALITEIKTLLATKSWRITAPLRTIHGTPDWMKRRLRDVRYAYVHGGVRGVAQRSLMYFPKQLKWRPDIPSGAATVSVGNQDRVLPGGQGASTRAPRTRRALADVFVFSIIDWHFRIQRPQHLAREFARAGHRVYFFSNHFEDTKEAGFSVERLDETLSLYQVRLKVSGAPAIYFAPPTDEAVRQIAAGIQLFMDWSGTDRSWSLVQHAYWYPTATHMQSECLAYDCMDHHEGFGNVPQALLDLEERMMRRADLLVATSSWLEAHARKYNRNVEVIRNAGQYADFCDAPAERYQDAQGRKIIGYYGAIAEWFDADLVARVAEAFPNALVLLVGADTAGVGARLKALPNVEMTGEVPYARLPYYLYSFDVCMLPFKVIPLTLATNPVKVYEYLGAGSSVVSIDLPEMAQFDGLVRVSDSHEGFVEQIREALAALPDHDDVIEKRKAFAEGQTWTHRVQNFEQAVTALPRPKVSAVVLTYNNLGLTKDCLDSLEKYSTDVDLEIVVVDNASSDGSPAYLSSWAASRPNVKLILNEDNRGFAAGNNQGLAVASGDYLVILNNDTVVTRGWARRMVNHLRNEPGIGILGPLTNNIGNEAKVDTWYSTFDAMHVEAEEITSQNLGKLFELDTVAFFCAMLPRTTYERCGPICEDYGIGFFEDDDYCRRVQAAGLSVACAEDVFVHHHLSASFNKLGEEKRRKLFETNRAIYEAKWGPWTPHRH